LEEEHILGGPQQVLPQRDSLPSQQPAALAAHLPPLGQVKTQTHLLLALHILVSPPQGSGSLGQQVSAELEMHLFPQAFSFEQQSPLGMQVLVLVQRRWPEQHMVLGMQLLSAHLVSLLQHSPLGTQLLVLAQRCVPEQHMVLGMQLLSAHFVSLLQHWPLGMQVPLPQRRWPGQHVVLGMQLLSAHLVSLLQHWPGGRQRLPAQECGWDDEQPQVPLLQRRSPGHFLPQEPQLALSDFRLTQRLSHQT
jgi:hypothetical protein